MAAALLVSSAAARRPSGQRRAERALLAAAGLGELHLHVSALAGDVLSLGAFQASAATPEGVWRRTTGGRAVACGSGFLVVTLALPHRSALVSGDRFALRPEQVMNRAVRGLLVAIRGLGIEALYPGLDLVTAARRAIAHLAFLETAEGPTLFQAIVAAERPLSLTTILLERLDPAGSVPATPLAADAVSTLAELRGASAQPMAGDAAGCADLAARVAAGCAASHGVEALDLDPEVAAAMLDAEEPPAPVPALPEPPPAPPPDAGVALTRGLLGVVTAWARVSHGAIDAAGLYGDVIARSDALAAIGDGLRGCAAGAEPLAERLAAIVDGRRLYVLGLRPKELVELLLRACAAGGAR
jgi:hypothetical protein